MKRVENYAGQWVMDFDAPWPTDNEPARVLHHEAHSHGARAAACGEPLTGGVWARASGMFQHIRNHNRNVGEVRDVAYGCGCYAVCGPCLYWAGWVA